MAPKTRKSTTGPYDPNYEEELHKHNIWLIRRPRNYELPQNHHDIMSRHRAERPDDPRGPVITTHDAFLERNENANSSQEALFQQVFPIIWGTLDLEVACAYNRPFTRMRFAENQLKDAKPDYFEGIKPTQIEPEVKENLSEMIIPNIVSALTDPAAPNFFLELKTERLRASVVQMQAVIDGVLGARCMHSLQNYRVETPLYDGNAYTFSVSYFRHELRLYAIQIKSPSMNSSRPRYEAIQLDWFSMEDEEKYLPAINAYRNLRDLAEEYRKKFVEDANSRVSNPTLGPLSASGSAADHPDNEGNASHDDSAGSASPGAEGSHDVEEDSLGTGSQDDVQALPVTQPDATDDSAEPEPDFGPPASMGFQQQDVAESSMPQPRRSTRVRRRAREKTVSQSPPPRKRGRGARQ
jgi:hypothetical protein